MTATRFTRSGRLATSTEYPRVGLIGPPGMQFEVALTRDGMHGVITVLGGENMAACGFPPDMLREGARLMNEAAAQIERRHGKGESGLVVP